MDIISFLLDRNICIAVDKILEHLGDSDLNTCRQVSKKWKSWIDHEFVPKRLDHERRMVFVWTYGRLKVTEIPNVDEDIGANDAPEMDQLRTCFLGPHGATLQIDNELFDVSGCLPKKRPLGVTRIQAQPRKSTHFTYSKPYEDDTSYDTKIRLASLSHNKKVWSSCYYHRTRHDYLLTDDYFVYVGYTDDAVVEISQVDLISDEVTDDVDRLDVPECIWKETPEYSINDPTIKELAPDLALIRMSIGYYKLGAFYTETDSIEYVYDMAKKKLLGGQKRALLNTDDQKMLINRSFLLNLNRGLLHRICDSQPDIHLLHRNIIKEARDQMGTDVIGEDTKVVKANDQNIVLGVKQIKEKGKSDDYKVVTKCYSVTFELL